MMRKFRKDRLFHKELSIYDFSIPEFLKWFAEQDISKYVKIVEVPIPDETLMSIITVVNGSVAVDGASVSISQKEGITDENGRCIITDIPVSDIYQVIVMKDDIVKTQEFSDIGSIIIDISSEIENNEEDNNIIDETETQTTESEGSTETPASGGFVQQGDEF